MTKQFPFQSTHPRGVRHVLHVLIYLICTISIHAPTWGATSRRVDNGIGKVFQSTHPRGVRLSLQSEATPVSYFNPRTHVGCDPFFTYLLCQLFAFQSTHPRGVRHALLFVLFQFCPFQSTHPRGVRRSDLTNAERQTMISIHAPTWGATLNFCAFLRS